MSNPYYPPENTGVAVSVASPTRIRFAAVRLDHDVDRLGGAVGLATSSTSYFGAAGKCTVELDVPTGLVHITHQENGASIVVPRERVKRFEPEVKPAAK